MPGRLVKIITSSDLSIRNSSLDESCANLSFQDLIKECSDLERFRKNSNNLYDRVRALFFLYAVHRFHLPVRSELPARGFIDYTGFKHLLERRFEEAISLFLKQQSAAGPTDAISSALASAYHGLAFQTLADQVCYSVRSVHGNQWMFRIGHPLDHPLRFRPELLELSAVDGSYPVLRECTPVRMDLTHSGWSDIFFLGMDFPEAARVLNVSIDLAVVGRNTVTCPPVEAYLRVIDQPLLRLTSVDLEASADICDLAEVFDFAKDYLGLLKAAVIASGIIPPGVETSNQSLAEILNRVIGPGLGLEIVSRVNNIPKGSRLAVSTNLLGSIIAVCMRATGQAKSLTGPLQEEERRLVAARAILGEWLGGSGGGWQDSGGLWPGTKLIEGVTAQEGDPEYGISRGRLLPRHQILDHQEMPPEARENLQQSLVLVHGGLAQNVGPILEMVTEKYLLRSSDEWQARKELVQIMDEIHGGLGQCDIRSIGAATTRNFFGPIQTIVPWASNYFTEILIRLIRDEFQDQFWGFTMLGGMSGGGMGFVFNPKSKQAGQQRLLQIMQEQKAQLQYALPFAMDPVVYDFSVNETGTAASFLKDKEALLPSGYYALTIPQLLRADARTLSPLRRLEFEKFGSACRDRSELQDTMQPLFDRLLPPRRQNGKEQTSLRLLLEENGFDPVMHEQIQSDLRNGRISIAQNRLPASTIIEDVEPGDVLDAGGEIDDAVRAAGCDALAAGEIAVVTLAAGAGSRWAQGAGTVKALHPFCKLDGKHRTFLEVHLSMSRRTAADFDVDLPHIFSTSYLTHGPIESFLYSQNNYDYSGPPLLSVGRAIGLRLVPMVRDLRFAWEEMAEQELDEQKQKLRESTRAALINWAQQAGEASDYTDNLPLQCLHPIGHWYEIPNLLLNGTLAELIERRPQLKYLLLKNVDTLGANVDPLLLGMHIRQGACLSFEVINRRVDDHGGGLARVNGRLRLVEGLAMPREEDEFRLSYYNTMTTWIDIDQLLGVLELKRSDLRQVGKIAAAIRHMVLRMPTYVTLKEVKKRWGHGQEDIFPVAQFEKLWSDITTIPEVSCRFLGVPRRRGQQLKDQAQLDGWLRDGSADYVASLCQWS